MATTTNFGVSNGSAVGARAGLARGDAAATDAAALRLPRQVCRFATVVAAAARRGAAQRRGDASLATLLETAAERPANVYLLFPRV